MITAPSIGRVLWLHLSFMTEDDQPLAALVAFVHPEKDENDDYLVNLGYLDKFGNTASVQRVRLWQGEEADRPIGETYCEWMPYQKQQAEKQAGQTTFSVSGASPSGMSGDASSKITDLLK